MGRGRVATNIIDLVLGPALRRNNPYPSGIATDPPPKSVDLEEDVDPNEYYVSITETAHGWEIHAKYFEVDDIDVVIGLAKASLQQKFDLSSRTMNKDKEVKKVLRKCNTLKANYVKAAGEIDRLKSEVARHCELNEELNKILKEVVKSKKVALNEASHLEQLQGAM
ncbi:unnamed protein product [Ilex paraguariensis]|uniref:Uncharacterized protein n=1 Tax=Ilex paraguariensis TaxID=185542 RepID=A0ABC8RWN6_9AQUA